MPVRFATAANKRPCFPIAYILVRTDVRQLTLVTCWVLWQKTWWWLQAHRSGRIQLFQGGGENSSRNRWLSSEPLGIRERRGEGREHCRQGRTLCAKCWRGEGDTCKQLTIWYCLSTGEGGGRGKAGRLGSELPALWRLNEMCYKSFSFSKATGKPMHGCRQKRVKITLAS